MAGRAGPWAIHRTGGWTPCASYKEGVSRTASGRTSGLRMFQPQTISATSHGGAFWAGGSSQGTSEPPRCWQGLKGRPERRERGEPSRGLEPVPGLNQSVGLVAVRLGPGPLWLLWAEIEGMRDSARGLEPVIPGEGGIGGPRSGDSLSSLTTLYGSLSQGSVPQWREIAGQGGCQGRGQCLPSVFYVPGAS